MSSTHLNKNALIIRVTLLAAGLEKHLPGASLTVASTVHKTPDLVASLAALPAAVTATAAAKAAWETAIEEEEALTAQLLPLVSGVRAIVYAMYSNAPDTLGDFGMSQHKQANESLAEKVAAAAKAKATRIARHTLGPKQRKAITGAAVAPASPASCASKPATTNGATTPRAGE
jgi:hypothetical protein